MAPIVCKNSIPTLILTMKLQCHETDDTTDEEPDPTSATRYPIRQADLIEENDCLDDSSATSSRHDLVKTTDVLLNCIETQQKDMEQLSTQSLLQQNQIQALKEDVSELKQDNAEISKLYDFVKCNHDVIEQSFDALQNQVNDQKNISYDGTYTWKISHFRQAQADAESGRQQSIYSPAFYSSSTGYKMCCRLYPFGDGNARSTHLSVFFVLMRGEYDDILTFPFVFKIIFILYDLSGQGRHILDSFRPDVKSNSFQKPQFSMNIASGIPKFLPLQMLQHDHSPYIKNDTIYIKIIVDFCGLPKAVLPYMVTLNPGLPDSLRKELTRREIEKQT